MLFLTWAKQQTATVFQVGYHKGKRHPA